MLSPARAPRFSMSQISTFPASFADDVDAYAAAGLDGIGIWELKLPEDGDDAEALEAFERSGLESASAVPLVPSILPLPRLGGPTDPAERVDALCSSIHRLARLRPERHRLPDRLGRRPRSRRARGIVADGLRTLAAEAELAGVPVALEPYQRDGGEEWTIATSIPEAVELIDEAGGHPSLRLQFDLWHLWNTPTLVDDIRRESTASPASTSRTSAARPAAGPTACCRATASPTSRPCSRRSTRPAGTGCTTWRSSPTTARSAAHMQVHSGTFRPASSLAAAAPRCSRRGRAVRGSQRRRRNSTTGGR